MFVCLGHDNDFVVKSSCKGTILCFVALWNSGVNTEKNQYANSTNPLMSRSTPCKYLSPLLLFYTYHRDRI